LSFPTSSIGTLREFNKGWNNMKQLREVSFFLFRTSGLFIILCLLCGSYGGVISQESPPHPRSPAIAFSEDWASLPPPELFLKIEGGEYPPDINLSQESSFPNCNEPPSIDHFTAVAYYAYNESNRNYDIHLKQICSPYQNGGERLTTDLADDVYPRLSFDSKQIVFVSYRTGNAEIYVMDASGKNIRRLTNHPKIDTMPAFSPDGKQIAFVSDRTGIPEIFVMDVDGSKVRQLTFSSSNTYNLTPDWSPDGKKIAWARGTPVSRSIYVMDATGANARKLTPAFNYLSRPIWSPSGKRLAFQYDPDKDDWFDLGVVQADGSGLNKIPIIRNDNSTIDYVIGGWGVKESYLIANSIHYFWDGYGYRILQSPLGLVSMSGATSYVISEQYSFDPDTRSMDSFAPILKISPLPQYSQFNATEVKFTITDNGLSGIWEYFFEYSTNPVYGWVPLINESPKGAVSNVEQVYKLMDWGYLPKGQKIFFRGRARDSANNQDIEDPENYASTILYDWTVYGQVTDIRGVPLKDVQIQTNNRVINPVQTNKFGQVFYYLKEHTQVYASLTRNGFGILPAMTWPSTSRFYHQFFAVLPPNTSLIQNGHFESTAGFLEGWQKSGLMMVDKVPGHTGTSAVRLANNCQKDSEAAAKAVLSQTVTIPTGMKKPTLSFLYRVDNPCMANGSHVILNIESDSGITQQNILPNSSDWQHTWFDMSNWSGQTIAVQFISEKTEKSPALLMIVDEVALGEWLTPTVETVNPAELPHPVIEGQLLFLHGHSLTNETQVRLNSLEVKKIGIDPATGALVVELPFNLLPGKYDITVRNPDGLESTTSGILSIGKQFSLPVIMK
jgi:hypothetical protein